MLFNQHRSCDRHGWATIRADIFFGEVEVDDIGRGRGCEKSLLRRSRGESISEACQVVALHKALCWQACGNFAKAEKSEIVDRWRMQWVCLEIELRREGKEKKKRTDELPDIGPYLYDENWWSEIWNRDMPEIYAWDPTICVNCRVFKISVREIYNLFFV